MPILSLFHWTAFKREKTNRKDVYLPSIIFHPIFLFKAIPTISIYKHQVCFYLFIVKGFYFN